MNKNILVSLLVGMVVGLVGGYSLLRLPVQQPKESNYQDLGAITVPSQSTTTHGTALQSSLLFQWESNAQGTMSDLRAPMAFVSSTSATFKLPALGTISTTTSTAATSTAFTGAVAGDFVLVSTASSSETARSIVGIGRGCNTDVVCLQFFNGSSSVVTDSGMTWILRLLPQATFARPATLRVTTTTTPYSN